MKEIDGIETRRRRRADETLDARELDIAVGTIKVHVKHLLKQLGLRSRVEAAVWVVEVTGAV